MFQMGVNPSTKIIPPGLLVLTEVSTGLQIYNVMYTFKKHHHILSICMHVQARLDRSEGSGMCTICT